MAPQEAGSLPMRGGSIVKWMAGLCEEMSRRSMGPPQANRSASAGLRLRLGLVRKPRPILARRALSVLTSEAIQFPHVQNFPKRRKPPEQIDDRHARRLEMLDVARQELSGPRSHRATRNLVSTPELRPRHSAM
jgi:hypothetical protein